MKITAQSKTIVFITLLSLISLLLLWTQPHRKPTLRPEQTKQRDVPKYCDQSEDWMSCFRSHYASVESQKKYTFTANRNSPASETIDRSFRSEFTIRNLENRTAPSFELWCYLPMADIPGQTLLETKLSHPAKLAADSLGHRILYFRLNSFAPNETRIFKLFNRVSLDKTPPTIDNPPDPRLIEPDPLIESRSEIIQKTAARIRGHGAQEKAKNIYTWIRNNIAPLPLDGKDHGAIHAITQKKGDCTEMALLFTALCWASGIPARTLTGYRLDQDRAVDARDLHNWAQFHAHGKWHLADPHTGNFMENAWQYIALEIFSSTHKNPVQDYHHFRYAAAEDLRFSVRH